MKVLGLMSGTSLDGIDTALLEVEGPERVEGPDGTGARGDGIHLGGLRWELLAFRTQPYDPNQRRRIQEAIEVGGVRELATLHTTLGEWFADAARALLDSAGIPPEAVAAIGSHGQTVWHEPPLPGSRGSSLQIGCPATIAEGTGIGVVSDFRARDLAAGGHGAPLVPWADRIFFSSPENRRAVQNLGGMANVTWLPPSGDPAPLLAFDTGPGVALLDGAASLATGGRQTYDEDGALAREGEVVESVLREILANPFFVQPPPRSTGRELFGLTMVAEVAAEVGAVLGQKLVPGEARKGWPHVLATLTALTSRSIGDSYRKWVVPRGVDEVFLTGGGSRNPALFQAIADELWPLPVLPGESLGMNSDAREAAAFALLAWAHISGFPGNVPEATGSGGSRVLGSWTPGRKGSRS